MHKSMDRASQNLEATVASGKTPERCGRGLSREGHARLHDWLVDAQGDLLARMRAGRDAPSSQVQRVAGTTTHETLLSGVPSQR